MLQKIQPFEWIVWIRVQTCPVKSCWRVLKWFVGFQQNIIELNVHLPFNSFIKSQNTQLNGQEGNLAILFTCMLPLYKVIGALSIKIGSNYILANEFERLHWRTQSQEVLGLGFRDDLFCAQLVYQSWPFIKRKSMIKV